ncbi:hypothetical protein pipiens_015059 [Culex pipiens pipiens]|uniref:Uncharacterized protein n=1 Tax=Culex pipiens pipiens TaxID=38569 RepID=A0ABD1CS33_CULPP
MLDIVHPGIFGLRVTFFGRDKAWLQIAALLYVCAFSASGDAELLDKEIQDLRFCFKSNSVLAWLPSRRRTCKT